MPAIRRYSVKVRLYDQNIIVGYRLQAPDGTRCDVDMATAIDMARNDLINHVRVANGRLVGNGIKLDRLDKVQV